jgi:hypothetical protein
MKKRMTALCALALVLAMTLAPSASAVAMSATGSADEAVEVCYRILFVNECQ